jgi:hypothetical protein
MSLRQRFGLNSDRLCTSAKTLPVRGLPRARCPPVFCEFFKNPDNRVETDRTSERFFDGNSILREVKAMACVGRGVVVRSKFLVPTSPRLPHEGLRTLSESSGLHPTFAQKHSGDHVDSGPKMISQTKPRQVTSRTFRVLEGCEQVVTLRGLRGSSFPTPTPPWLQSEARSSRFSKIDYALLHSSSGAHKCLGCNAT